MVPDAVKLPVLIAAVLAVGGAAGDLVVGPALFAPQPVRAWSPPPVKLLAPPKTPPGSHPAPPRSRHHHGVVSWVPVTSAAPAPAGPVSTVSTSAVPVPARHHTWTAAPSPAFTTTPRATHSPRHPRPSRTPSPMPSAAPTATTKPPTPTPTPTVTPTLTRPPQTVPAS